jgi:hypothetical protein
MPELKRISAKIGPGLARTAYKISVFRISELLLAITAN